MIIKTARRNIWRNKIRTIITVASVFLVVYLGMVMRSIQIGTFGRIVNNLVSSYSGNLQIHKKGYSDDKTINNVFALNQKDVNKIKDINHVKAVVPRVSSFALASSGEQTKGCLVTGISPEEENAMTEISKKVIAGNYLKTNDNGALIGDKLASFLNISVNDTIILLGQGYHSVTAAGKYPVRGILHFPSPELNGRLVYITLQEAQPLYSLGNKLTGIAVLADNDKYTAKIKNEIQNILKDNNIEVEDWGEMLPELKDMIRSKTVSSYVMLGLFYMIAGFGVLGTVIMMTAERKKEFGLLIAIGMKKARLGITVFFETLFLGLIGLALGFAASLPLILYFSANPIHLSGEIAKMYESYGFESVIQFSSDTGYMFSQIFIVGIIVLVSVLYPFIKISLIKPVKAMRN